MVRETRTMAGTMAQVPLSLKLMANS